jgi:hypothetical protein
MKIFTLTRNDGKDKVGGPNGTSVVDDEVAHTQEQETDRLAEDRQRKKERERKQEQELQTAEFAEELRATVYSAVGGDPLALFKCAHRGSPDHVDRNGWSKRLIYDRAQAGDHKFFRRWAEILQGDSVWLDYMVSTRTAIKKDDDDKLRPIDIPSEMKRAYALVIRQRMVAVLKKKYGKAWLSGSVIGFRAIADFPDFARRNDGPTIQDVFASRVCMLSKKHPWIASLDQTDAFGNLPHQAIKFVLQEHGMCKPEIRRLIELVRIRSWHNGKKLWCQGYGIEQGNPLAPLVFNIVHSYIAEELAKNGIQSCFFGDDIVLGSDSEPAAIRAFQESYLGISTRLGFKNIRPIGEGRKATKLYDTRLDSVPLLKTFEVNQNGIRLTPGKARALLASIKGKPTLKKLRRRSTYKTISKAFLEELLNQPNGVPETNDTEDRMESLEASLVNKENHTERLSPLGKADEGAEAKCSSQDDMTASIKDGSLVEAESALNGSLLVGPYIESNDVGPTGNVFTAPTNPEIQVSDGRQNGRREILRDHAEPGVTPRNGGEAVDHHRPLPSSVKPERMHLEQFALGATPDLGDRYRPNGQTGEPIMLDLRGLSHAIAERKFQTHAVMRLCRAASVRGRVQVLVHPSDPCVYDSRILGGDADPRYRLARRRTNFDSGGIVLELRRRVVKKREVRVLSPPQPADLIVRAVRPTKDYRKLRVVLESEGQRNTRSIKVDTLNPAIAKLAATAEALKSYRINTVTIPATGMAQELLRDKPIRARNVALADAMKQLSHWSWKKKGDWLLGTPKPNRQIRGSRTQRSSQ